MRRGLTHHREKLPFRRALFASTPGILIYASSAAIGGLPNSLPPHRCSSSPHRRELRGSSHAMGCQQLTRSDPVFASSSCLVTGRTAGSPLGRSSLHKPVPYFALILYPYFFVESGRRSYRTLDYTEYIIDRFAMRFSIGSLL